MSSEAFSNSKIKTPNVSGQFYSADSKKLVDDLERFFSTADIVPYEKPVDIVIAPHAGYVYSGEVAAYGFKAISKHHYKTIVILAPSHFFSFDGISIWDEGGFQTPLGVAEVDEEFSKSLSARHEKFYFEPKAFEREHSLEVEIPFLQNIFNDFKIVPVVMGYPNAQLLDDFALALNELIGERDDVLIVVSTDMSHYHDDKTARKMDYHALGAIKNLEAKQIWKESHQKTMEMCGFIPVTTAMLYAKYRGLNKVEILRYSNSGDISGDKKRVVGYASILIYKENSKRVLRNMVESSLSPDQKKKLIEIARTTVEEYVLNEKIPEIVNDDPRLLEAEGAFVTIRKKNGELRGCIGNIIGRGPLCFLVRDMAVSSATKDPRFPALKKEELDEVDVEVSVLSKPRIIQDIDEIKMGQHGVIISRGRSSGVFLPQVATETGWSKEEFLSQLCSQKAGLSADCWQEKETIIEVFTAEVFSEEDVY